MIASPSSCILNFGENEELRQTMQSLLKINTRNCRGLRAIVTCWRGSKVHAPIVAYYPYWSATTSPLTNSLCTQNCHSHNCWGCLVLHMAKCELLDSCQFKICFLSTQAMILQANIGDLQQITLEIHHIFFFYYKILF